MGTMGGKEQHRSPLFVLFLKLRTQFCWFILLYEDILPLTSVSLSLIANNLYLPIDSVKICTIPLLY
jgi:hypothetical protein